MTMRQETGQFLKELEAYAKITLRFKEEIGLLLDQSRESGKMQVFEDVVFFSKFVSKSHELIKRIGPGGEGYDKLSAEFQSGIEKTTSLLKTIVKEMPEDMKIRFMGRFFGMDPDSFASLMALVRELSWVKNWMLDRRKVP
jgi:hypothetical protein